MPTLQDSFPRLSAQNHQPTSPDTPNYNCIAWAAEEDDVWWWPDPKGFAYWPAGVDRAETVAAFIAAFGTLGYVACAAGDSQHGVQKIALYTLNGAPTHMARQLPDGTWTSKLGQAIDISHQTLDALDGPAYGQATHFFSRAVPI